MLATSDLSQVAAVFTSPSLLAAAAAAVARACAAAAAAPDASADAARLYQAKVDDDTRRARVEMESLVLTRAGSREAKIAEFPGPEQFAVAAYERDETDREKSIDVLQSYLDGLAIHALLVRASRRIYSCTPPHLVDTPAAAAATAAARGIRLAIQDAMFREYDDIQILMQAMTVFRKGARDAIDAGLAERDVAISAEKAAFLKFKHNEEGLQVGTVERAMDTGRHEIALSILAHKGLSLFLLELSDGSLVDCWERGIRFFLKARKLNIMGRQVRSHARTRGVQHSDCARGG